MYGEGKASKRERKTEKERERERERERTAEVKSKTRKRQPDRSGCEERTVLTVESSVLRSMNLREGKREGERE